MPRNIIVITWPEDSKAYEALTKQVTAEAVIDSELTQGADGVILKARLQFTCTAEKLIFELRARSI